MQNLTLASLSLTAAVAGGVAFIPEPPTRPFMTVHSVTIGDDFRVYSDRTVDYPVIAEWMVAVVPEDQDGPSCRTIPGSKEGEGWNDYVVGRHVTDWTIDKWVGDPGCESRLEDEKYRMFITWTPHDGTPPASYSLEFDYAR